jgi:hypothetical protein
MTKNKKETEPKSKSKTRKVKHTAILPGPYQCHPRIKKAAAGCLPAEILQEAAKKLGVKATRKALEEKLGIEAGKEWTFLQALPVEKKEELAKNYLRPHQPSAWKEDPDKWLDSTNIEEVMKQYEDAYPDFEFMGPYPIDFAAPNPYKGGSEKTCLINEVCELRVTEALLNGTRHIGFIYNLDPHFKGGSHWVAAFIDIPRHQTYYFDSYGMAPPKQIAKFMQWVKAQDPKMKLQYNGRRFQRSDTECGMYSLYFIIRMIAGDNFRSFTRQSPRDEEMLKLRHWIFST